MPLNVSQISQQLWACYMRTYINYVDSIEYENYSIVTWKFDSVKIDKTTKP